MSVYFVPYFNREPRIEYASYDRASAELAVLLSQTGEFTAHDRWEKAERKGWTIELVALRKVRRKP